MGWPGDRKAAARLSLWALGAAGGWTRGEQNGPRESAESSFSSAFSSGVPPWPSEGHSPRSPFSTSSCSELMLSPVPSTPRVCPRPADGEGSLSEDTRERTGLSLELQGRRQDSGPPGSPGVHSAQLPTQCPCLSCTAEAGAVVTVTVTGSLQAPEFPLCRGPCCGRLSLLPQMVAHRQASAHTVWRAEV